MILKIGERSKRAICVGAFLVLSLLIYDGVVWYGNLPTVLFSVSPSGGTQCRAVRFGAEDSARFESCAFLKMYKGGYHIDFVPPDWVPPKKIQRPVWL